MEIDREHVIQLLREKGHDEKVQHAIDSLPQKTITKSTRKSSRSLGSTRASWSPRPVTACSASYAYPRVFQ
jgi:hypothetical protein